MSSSIHLKSLMDSMNDHFMKHIIDNGILKNEKDVSIGAPYSSDSLKSSHYHHIIFIYFSSIRGLKIQLIRPIQLELELQFQPPKPNFLETCVSNPYCGQHKP